MSVVDMSASIGLGGGVRVSGFHPDLLLPLINAIDGRLFITINDDVFTASLKYLSPLWDSDSVVFVSRPSVDTGAPVGFAPSYNHLAVRAKEMLAEGLGAIKTIVSSEGGASIPILGCGINSRLVFTSGVSFEECCGFLVSENYVLSDFVTVSGEFSIRGGIVDVFPFSSYCPYRINFLDEFPIVFRFNVDTQLTTERVNNFILFSISKNEPLALKDVSLQKFLPATLCSLDELIIGNPNNILKQVQLKTITHRQFCAVSKKNYSSIETVGDLSSIGLVGENNNFTRYCN